MRICGTKLSLCIFLSIPNGIREIRRKEEMEGGNERSRERVRKEEMKGGNERLRERVRKAERCGGRK